MKILFLFRTTVWCVNFLPTVISKFNVDSSVFNQFLVEVYTNVCCWVRNLKKIFCVLNLWEFELQSIILVLELERNENSVSFSSQCMICQFPLVWSSNSMLILLFQPFFVKLHTNVDLKGFCTGTSSSPFVINVSNKREIDRHLRIVIWPRPHIKPEALFSSGGTCCPEPLVWQSWRVHTAYDSSQLPVTRQSWPVPAYVISFVIYIDDAELVFDSVQSSLYAGWLMELQLFAFELKRGACHTGLWKFSDEEINNCASRLCWDWN